MRLYPIFLKLENASCCVIGGGTVALRKVKALLKSKARITVVSPVLCPGLLSLKKKSLFQYKKSKYKNALLKNQFLVIAATNDAKVNKKISADAATLQILVNVVDSPIECNFYVPSLLSRDGLLLAISTQGEFPGMAKKIKEECSHIFQKYAKSFKKLAALRKDIYNGDGTYKQKVIRAKSLMRPDILKMVESKKICNVDALKAHLKTR
ncbi:MAG: bifunctional precorrin-2 dehydrogenase/sirohydrochlorin ferrochelatase [Candidatus Omnitrophica bacterium]|nr:bifunctional precorrin-2 dehydrogenase/sirohydrochlorin ferrochelatase [Candidatus Omnitrophota bacterium]